MPIDMNVLMGMGGVVIIAVVYFVFLRNKKKGDSVALNPQRYQDFALIQRQDINHNTRLFRFALPSGLRLGLPTGKHISLMYTGDDNMMVMRSYTPVSSDDEIGFFDLVIKVYEQGKMTQHLEHMKIGDRISVKGPKGEIEYKGDGKFLVKRKDPNTRARRLVPQTVRHVGMIAGGTGITPMLQIMRDITKHHPADTTRVSLIFANVTEEDILLRDEIEVMKEQYSNINVYFTLDRPSAGWTQGKGFVTKDMISEHLPKPSEDTLVLVCGPPPMVKFMEKNLQDLEYASNQYFIY